MIDDPKKKQDQSEQDDSNMDDQGSAGGQATEDIGQSGMEESDDDMDEE